MGKAAVVEMKEQGKNIGRKDLIKVLLFTVLLGLITYLTVSNMIGDKPKFDALIESVKTANPLWVIVLLIGVPLVWIMTDAFVLWILVRNGGYPKYKYRQALAGIGTYVIFSLLTPFQSGGQAFLVFMMKKQGIKYSTAISTTFISAVMFQLITVPVSTALFIYVNNAGTDMYQGFEWLSNANKGMTILGFEFKDVAWAGTIISLAVNLVAMIIPIVISLSSNALNVVTKLSSYVKGQKFNKNYGNGKFGKVLLVGICIAFVLFLLPAFVTIDILTIAKYPALGLATVLTILLFKFGLYTDQKKKEKAYGEIKIKMLDYRDTFRSMLFNKKVVALCLTAMFIKEANHSFSMVWASFLDGMYDINIFLMVSVKNVLTLAQTVVPTPGGSGGAELFYQAGAWSLLGKTAGADQSIFIALATRVSTYWMIIVIGLMFKLYWRPSRLAFGAEVNKEANKIVEKEDKINAKKHKKTIKKLDKEASKKVVAKPAAKKPAAKKAPAKKPVAKKVPAKKAVAKKAPAKKPAVKKATTKK